MERTADAPQRDHGFAMVVKKAGLWMKESSLAEKAIAIFLALIVGLLFNLNREAGETSTLLEEHIRDHPNVALERRIDRHEEQLHNRR